MKNTKILQQISSVSSQKTLVSYMTMIFCTAVSTQAYSYSDDYSQNYGTSYNNYSTSDDYSDNYDNYDNYNDSYGDYDNYNNYSDSSNDYSSDSYNNYNYSDYDPSSYSDYDSGDYDYDYNNDNSVKDKLGALIEKKTLEYEQSANVLYSSGDYYVSSNNNYLTNYSNYDNSNYGDGYSYQPDEIEYEEAKPNYNDWLDQGNNRQEMLAYKRYLISNIGASNVPPMEQLLSTARQWRKCYQSAYEVPPRYLWSNMLSTLRLYAKLKRDNVLPYDTFIRSVYRNPSLNRCAGGARGSKHKANSAIDLWSPSFEFSKSAKQKTQNKMCNFWSYQGQQHDMGLGLYSTGAIHIDTSKYRKWGTKNASRYSACRSSW